MDIVPTPAGRLVLTAKRFVAPDAEAVANRWERTTIVCLNPERELMQWPDYIDWLRDYQPERAIWFSMPDWKAPPLDEARILLDEVVERLRADGTVVMHCSHGQGRTGTMAIAALMLMGIPRAEAELTVATHRPGAGTNGGSQAALIAQLAADLT